MSATFGSTGGMHEWQYSTFHGAFPTILRTSQFVDEDDMMMVEMKVPSPGNTGSLDSASITPLVGRSA